MGGQAVRALLALVAVAALWMTAAQFQQLTARTIPAYLHGMGGGFKVRSADGVVTDHDLRGRAVLLYFGYSHCPDACPQALGLMARAVRRLPVSMQARVQLLFISLDPRRDTPSVLKRYVAFFDHRMIGATASPSALQQIARRWRVSYKVPAHPKRRDYVVSHSTFIYLLNPWGKTVALFGDGSRAATIAATLRAWL